MYEHGYAGQSADKREKKSFNKPTSLVFSMRCSTEEEELEELENRMRVLNFTVRDP